MSEAPPKPAAGWYPTPDGDQRYWDGQAWVDLPPPPSNPEVKATGFPPVRGPRDRRRVLIASLIVAVLVLAAGGAAVAWQLQSAAVAAEQAAEEAAAEAAAERVRQEQERADAEERRLREESVPDIEEAIRVMAEEHVAEDFIDGPVLNVSCSPVGGGSTDDLAQLTTVFECFVANQDNGDGTLSGYYYNATMNWSTGSFTYGFGQP